MENTLQLLCPICGEALTRVERSYTCTKKHNFDVAKEGYISLLHGKTNYSDVGDDAAMVAGRAKAHELAAYAKVAARIAEVINLKSGAILDIGCGEGFFTRALSAAAGVQIVGVDISKPALAKAAKAHKDGLYLRCDVARHTLPFAAETFERVVSIFSPRPLPEIKRVLKSDGRWVMVTATQAHLQELRYFLPMATIGEQKLEAATQSDFKIVSETTCEVPQTLTHDELVAVIEMSPSVHLLRREFADTWKTRLPEKLNATFSFSLSVMAKK